MKESVIKAFSQGLYGKNTHIDAKKAIEGLTPTIAKFKPDNDFHSCWDLIHHMVVWQEAIFEAIRGKDVDWEKISKEKNWPDLNYFEDETNFDNLIEKFLEGIKTAEEFLKEGELHKPMPAWSNQPVLRGFIVLLQHNSYHLGQIMAVRKTLNI
ncbi:MAG: DinB family protein [Candidatus Hodarchaeales archaeon]|jgi:uncharacterized damage-inducible protein DinB